MRVLIAAWEPNRLANYRAYLKEMGRVDMATRDFNLKYMRDYELLVLPGGCDVHPKFYGQEIKYPALLDLDEDRDRFEFKLVDHALRLGLRIMGICRGFQVLAVRFGCELYQDLKEEGFWDVHTGTEDRFHMVKLQGKLSPLGNSWCVNSRHHQGIDSPPFGSEILATSPDDLVEAFWLNGVLAVQWHPERQDCELSRFLIHEVLGR